MSDIEIPMNDFQAKAVLVVYGRNGERRDAIFSAYGLDHSSKTEEYYVETFPATEGPDGIELGAGKPMSMAFLRDMVKGLAEGHLVFDGLGLLPDTVLSTRADGDLAWYRPAGPQSVFIEYQGRQVRGMARYPAMLFMLKNTNLYAFALKTGKERPSEHSGVFRMPLLNGYSDGHLCMGSARVPKEGLAAERMEKGEDAFFQSTFNHNFTGNHKLVHSGDVVELWERLVRTGTPFPEEQLVRFKPGATIADMLREHGF